MERECQQIRDLMDSYLAGELLVETNHMVQRHVAGCLPCQGELESRRRLREVLKEAASVDVDTAAALARIRQALDPPPTGWRVSARGKVVAAIAATLLLSTALWLARNRTLTEGVPGESPESARQQIDRTAFVDAVVAHKECLLTIPKDRRFDPVRVAARLDSRYHGMEQAIGLYKGEYEVIDAHTCVDGGRTYAHVVVRRQDKLTSLLVHAASRGNLPDAERHVSVSGLERPVHAGRFGQYEAEGYQVNDHQLLIVSDMPRADVESVASWLLPAATSFVAKVQEPPGVPRTR